MTHDEAHPGDKKEIQVLFSHASDYASSALEFVIGRAADRPEALERIQHHYVDLVFALEVEYIFPGLPREQRDTLVSLMKVRNGLQVQFGGLRQWRTPTDRESHTEVVRNLKVEFLRLKSQIERQELDKQLDPLQRKILAEELLSLPPDKSNSTTFFHRQNPAPPKTEAASAEAIPAPATSAEPPTTLPSDPPSNPSAENAWAVSASDSPPVKDSAKRLGQVDKKLLFVAPEVEDYRACIAELGEAGYQVQFAAELKRALEYAIDNPPDLVILDLALPGDAQASGDSCGATRFLRGLGLLGEQEEPLVIGLRDPGPEIPMQAGDEACRLTVTLQKPVDAQRLLGAVCVALDDTKIENYSDRCFHSGRTQPKSNPVQAS